eukprot:3926322-Pyramimonas_sp.AAC.1
MDSGVLDCPQAHTLSEHLRASHSPATIRTVSTCTTSGVKTTASLKRKWWRGMNSKYQYKPAAVPSLGSAFPPL